MTAGEPYDDGEEDEEENRADHGADDAEDQPDAHLELRGLGSSRRRCDWRADPLPASPAPVIAPGARQT